MSTRVRSSIYGTVNSIFIEVQPDSTNIKNDPRNVRTLSWFSVATTTMLFAALSAVTKTYFI